jgi:Helix-turn-helix domain
LSTPRDEARARGRRVAVDPTQILHVKNAALLLQKSEKAVYQDVARKRIPFRKFGGRVIFLKDELEKFLMDLPGVTLEEARENLAARNGEAQ